MRGQVLIGLCAAAGVAGCFDPHPPTGAPCDPTEPSCPLGQVCTAGAGGYTCEPPGGSPDAAATAADAPSGTPDGRPVPDAAPGSPDAHPADAGLPPIHLEYTAAIAECLDPLDPDPDLCRALNGDAQLAIDSSDTGTGEPWVGFVEFKLDSALAGHTVTSVVLRMTATSDPKADGPDAGTVWEVTPFSSGSLDTETPQHVGPALAGSPGAVLELAVIDWALPVDSVAPSSSVYLGLETDHSDGVNYWNLAGSDPPLLIIDAQ